MSSLVAFDSNVLTAFLTGNSNLGSCIGDPLESFRLFLYAPNVVILPTVALEADRIPRHDWRREHLTWVWYHFEEAQLRQQAERIENRSRELLPLHPQSDGDDCRIVAEAEAAGADVLATLDKKLKRLQPHTLVRLLTAADCLTYLGITRGAEPYREPADPHPHAGAAWWRL